MSSRLEVVGKLGMDGSGAELALQRWGTNMKGELKKLGKEGGKIASLFDASGLNKYFSVGAIMAGGMTGGIAALVGGVFALGKHFKEAAEEAENLKNIIDGIAISPGLSKPELALSGKNMAKATGVTEAEGVQKVSDLESKLQKLLEAAAKNPSGREGFMLKEMGVREDQFSAGYTGAVARQIKGTTSKMTDVKRVALLQEAGIDSKESRTFFAEPPLNSEGLKKALEARAKEIINASQMSAYQGFTVNNAMIKTPEEAYAQAMKEWTSGVTTQRTSASEHKRISGEVTSSAESDKDRKEADKLRAQADEQEQKNVYQEMSREKKLADLRERQHMAEITMAEAPKGSAAHEAARLDYAKLAGEIATLPEDKLAKVEKASRIEGPKLDSMQAVGAYVGSYAQDRGQQLVEKFDKAADLQAEANKKLDAIASNTSKGTPDVQP